MGLGIKTDLVQIGKYAVAAIDLEGIETANQAGRRRQRVWIISTRNRSLYSLPEAARLAIEFFGDQAAPPEAFEVISGPRDGAFDQVLEMLTRKTGDDARICAAQLILAATEYANRICRRSAIEN